jgi:hypothetical protein
MVAEQTQEGGLIDLGVDAHRGLARCYGCDWRGVPVHVGGVAQTECPKCEGFGDELDMRQTPYPTPEGGYLSWASVDDVICRIQQPRVLHSRMPKQGRNELCACGSLKKWKYCCGK